MWLVCTSAHLWVCAKPVRSALILRSEKSVAIFSLNHKAIGKSSQEKPYTASAHVRYITRNSACSQVLAERMPDQTLQAQSWFKSQEDSDRKNARVADKVMLALPVELNGKQRYALVKDYAEQVTEGKASKSQGSAYPDIPKLYRSQGAPIPDIPKPLRCQGMPYPDISRSL